MNCNDAVILLQQYVDRELNSAEIAEVQRHLDNCPHCLCLFHFEANMRRLVRRACNESAPDSLRERIIANGAASD